jgi:hypothetical protein
MTQTRHPPAILVANIRIATYSSLAYRLACHSALTFVSE